MTPIENHKLAVFDVSDVTEDDAYDTSYSCNVDADDVSDVIACL
jgi:hypothetical protein